jgi:hypothetical protein
VDVDREVLAEAWDHLRRFADRRVQLHHADGRAGFAPAAPFERIMVTAATPDLEPAWLEQLAPGGILLAPLALAPGLAYVVQGTVHEQIFDGRLTRAAYFMPLRAEDETGPSDCNRLLPAAGLSNVPAPWAGWFDRRRPRLNWLGFIQALACSTCGPVPGPASSPLVAKPTCARGSAANSYGNWSSRASVPRGSKF